MGVRYPNAVREVSVLAIILLLLAFIVIFPEIFGGLLACVLIAIRFLIGAIVWIIALGALALVLI